MRIPANEKWVQYNNTDKFVPISASRGINLDEDGYVKLSSRTFSVLSTDTDADMDLAIAIGRSATGDFEVVTEDEAFEIKLSESAFTTAQDDGTSAPSLAGSSWGTFWQNRWYVTRDTSLSYKTFSTGNWTANAYTGLTSAKTHCIEAFRNRNTLCIANGNVVQQINTSHSESTLAQLTLPSDYEVVGLKYANKKMGVLTRLASTVEGQSSEAFFFVWDGVTASAGDGEPLGSDAGVALASYLGTWKIITRTGQMRLWNGGGFQDVEAFPFYYKGQIWGNFTAKVGKGENLIVEGGLTYFNAAFDMSNFTRKRQQYLPYCPSGIWAFDPTARLYNRYSPSISTMKFVSVVDSDINTSTDLLTTSGTIPATGGVMRYVSSSDDSEIGGLNLRDDYYVIKVSATTFRLATTRQRAIDGLYIDLTSVTASTTHRFIAFDILDYATSIVESAGGIALTGTSNLVYNHLLFGVEIPDHDSSANLHHVCITVPEIESRGWFVTGKYFAQNKTDNNNSVVVKYKPLKNDDAIIVKSKTHDLVGLPVSTVQSGATAQWLSPCEFSTTADLADVLTAYTAGEEIECEILSGAGGGNLVKVSRITAGTGTYSVALAEDVLGASAGRYLHAQFDNFKVHASISTENQSDEGFTQVPIGIPSKWIEYKIELRGVDTTIENLDPSNVART